MGPGTAHTCIVLPATDQCAYKLQVALLDGDRS